MPDVRMPDGTVIQNVPDDATRDQVVDVWSRATGKNPSQLQDSGQIKRGQNQARQPQQQGQGLGQQLMSRMGQSQPPSVRQAGQVGGDASDLRSFAQGAGQRFFTNMERVPDIMANLGARSINQAVNQGSSALQFAANPGGFMSSMQDPPRGPTNDVRDAPMPQQNQLIQTPNLENQFLPFRPDIMSALQGTGEGAAALATGDFSQFTTDQRKLVEQQRQMTDRLREENPVAFALGQGSGDILTLITGRQPTGIGRARARGEALSRIRTERSARQSRTPELAPSVSSALFETTKRGRGIKNLLNRANRSVETGLEGATLSILNGEADPEEAFGFAAGTQAVGSMLIPGVTGLLSGSITQAGTKLGASSAAIGSLTQILKSNTPGGRDFILESMETGFNKVALGLSAGMVAGMGGLGRVTSKFPVSKAPKVADLISSLPRSGVLSTINEALSDPAVDTVMQQLRNDPQVFDKDAQRRLLKAIENEDASMSDTIERLARDKPKFREKFNELQGID